MPAILSNLKRHFHIVHVLMVLSFMLWIYLFRGFVFDRLALTGDALPYFDHFKFYIDHIMKGIYPLWNPFISDGVPNEFFLRRIGSFNPFYSIIVIFRSVGITFALAYLFFLSLYYWLGMIGFYLLSLKIYRNRLCAFIAYLLLMFSSMSTVLFSSFLILSIVPIIWFFYFFLTFFEKCERWSFLGMIFTLMIMVTTYLPFYFLHNFLLFLFCIVLIFPVRSINAVKQAAVFGQRNKLFSLIGLFCLGTAVVAGFLFFKELSTGELVMPIRHKDTDALNTLMVAPQTYVDGGIMATDLIGEQFNYFDRFILGRFYIPIVMCVFVLLGMIVEINKRIIFILTWAFLALVSGVYEATPVYRFLYDHVPYVKYMRNFQYFLWINILPGIILLAVENLRLFLQKDWVREKKKALYVGVILLIHAGLLVYFLIHKSTVLLSASLLLSFGIFYILIKRPELRESKLLWMLVAVAIVLHPIDVYTHLTKNSLKKEVTYDSERFLLSDYHFYLPERITQNMFYKNERDVEKILESKPVPVVLWYGLKTFYRYRESIPEEARSVNYRLQLYDQVERMDFQSPDYPSLSKSFLRGENRAFISKNDPVNPFENDITPPKAPLRQVITEISPEVKIKEFKPNYLKLNCDLPSNKFLVYGENFHHQREVFIDGKKTFLHQANLTFKGVWVPAGKHTVEFKYGQGITLLYNQFLLCIFYGVWIGLCILLYQQIRKVMASS